MRADTAGLIRKVYIRACAYSICIGTSLGFGMMMGAAARPQWSTIGQASKPSILYLEVNYQSIDGAIHTRRATAFVIRNPGYVLTNKHPLDVSFGEVIKSITASIGSREGTRYQLRIIDTGTPLDIALLAFANTPPELRAAKVGSSVELQVGDQVATWGFPQKTDATDYSPAFGFVTELRADIGAGISGIETDMTLYDGNSGGPVFNGQGEVVGLIVSKLLRSASGQSTERVGYFLPIERANKLLQEVDTAKLDDIGSSVPVAPEQLKEFPPGAISIDQLPSQVFARPQRVSSVTSLKAVLARYPAIKLRNNELKLEPPATLGNREITVYLSKLILQDSSVLTLNKNVTIVVGELEAHESTLRSFPENITAAPSGSLSSSAGTPGGSGAKGADAGSVRLIVIGAIKGRLKVDLSAQEGGMGSKGAVGVTGAAGRQGQSGSDHLFDCARGPGDGERGLQGGRGGPGGRGGDGGNAGNLSAILPTSEDFARHVAFRAKGGMAGSSGSGGPGGLGGPGGARGSQTAYCHGGADGPAGPAGPFGESGDLGHSGRDGTASVQVIDDALAAAAL